MPRLHFGYLILAMGIGLAACGGPREQNQESAADAAQKSTSYDDLLALFKDFREFQKPKLVDGVPDYTATAMAAQRRELENYAKRLAAIDPSGWSTAQQVDYHLVRAELNGLEFDHRAMRPWSRDPGFYITTPLGFGPRMHGSLEIPRHPGSSASRLAPIKLPLAPDAVEEFRRKLQAVPKILDQARGNLTEPAGDLARLAIRAKKKESAIYAELAAGLAEHHPDMVEDAEKARAACDRFREWLEQNESGWTAPAGVGVDNYNWYLKNVQLFPYTWEEIRILGEREYERTVSFLKLAEHQNRAIPMIEPAATAAEYKRRHHQAEVELLDFLSKNQILAVPDYLKPTEVESFDRPGGQRDFFQQAGDRDPRPLRAHNLPGHSLDSLMRRRDERPIRGPRRLYFIDGIRADGYATYLEEMTLQTGWFDKRPKTREITYILLAKRAARVACELKMHSNEWSFRQAFESLVSETPYWMGKDDPVAWFDLELYLRQPGYGMGYTLGKLQIEQLIADRHRQLGSRFNLREFHEQFLASGVIPIALIRWEMTGLDDQVKKLGVAGPKDQKGKST
jgi:hypothetical protein